MIGANDLAVILVGLGHRHLREDIGPILVGPIDHPGVVVAEHLEMVDAELLAGLLELDSAGGDDRCLVVALLAGLHPAGGVAQLTVRAGDDHGADALGGSPGQDAAGADGLVVRVGVDCHEGEGRKGSGHGFQRTCRGCYV